MLFIDFLLFVVYVTDGDIRWLGHSLSLGVEYIGVGRRGCPVVKKKHIKRVLCLSSLLRQKSFFLFGPRAVGKSYLIRQELILGKKPVVLFDLLQQRIFSRLSMSHSFMENSINEQISKQKKKMWWWLLMRCKTSFYFR